MKKTSMKSLDRNRILVFNASGTFTDFIFLLFSGKLFALTLMEIEFGDTEKW